MSETTSQPIEGAFRDITSQLPDVTEVGNGIIADTTRAASVEGGVPFGEYMVGGVGGAACATSIRTVNEEGLPPPPPAPKS